MTTIFIRKRSSCASGSGYVPSISMGFWVAITRKGDSSSCVTVPLVTVRSCMASSSADWVLGVARLISSASTRFAKTGPGLETQHLMSAIVGFHDHAADDVGGHQIGGELDARIAQAERARESPQQGGLAKTGHALQQHVTAGEQADEHAVDDTLLPDDDLCDLVANLI